MCLSSVFELREGAEPQQVASKISSAQVEGNKVVFTDIMGDETTLYGTIESVDLLENKIFVRVDNATNRVAE